VRSRVQAFMFLANKIALSNHHYDAALYFMQAKTHKKYDYIGIAPAEWLCGVNDAN